MQYLQYLTLSLTLSLAACGGSDDDTISSNSAEMQGAGGFVHSRIPDDMKAKNTVFLFAPQHCPQEAGMRADALEGALKRKGLTVMRKSHFRYSGINLPQKEIDEMEKTMEIMNGKLPIVFVNEYGKANPRADEVMAIYDATQ